MTTHRTGVFTRLKMAARAHAAALRHRRPSRKLRVILVVGPDGAVGTVAFLAAILRSANLKVGVATQHYVQIGDDRVKGSDQADISGNSFRLQALLAQMRRARCRYALIEVPRELPEHQFMGVRPSMVIVRRCGDNYTDQMTVTARLSILSRILARRPNFVVFNRDDPTSDELTHLSGHEGVISFGTHAKADARIMKVQMHPKGSAVSLQADHQTEIAFVTKLTGKQAMYNAAAAAAAAYVLRLPIAAIEQGIADLPPQLGQLQYVDIQRPYQVVLDAAATPGGLAETLETLKHFTKNRLIVVLGVPLGVPRTWLPLLGEITTKFADRAIITDGEYAAGQAPAHIREQLMQGVTAASGEAKTEEVADRRAAIEKALGIARRGDVVVIVAVTQHSYRQLGEERIPWSDFAIIEELFAA